MAARSKTLYQCEGCGAIAPKWSGQCGTCGSWNTLIETVAPTRPAGRRRQAGLVTGHEGPIDIDAVELGEETRVPSGIAELDRVLGGGVVAGSVVLLGGDPGIGKSTLLLQLLARLAGRDGLGVLYVSGEESARQVGLRARRLALDCERLRLLTETSLERILECCARERPKVLVIDSIQTVYSEALGSTPGSVAQVRECAAALVRHAKATTTSVFLAGHVTKEGSIAGPRVLEHMVDTVLYFEGDSGSRYRLVRAVKNRFGAINELGVFAMTDAGLREVSNPSAIFLARHDRQIPGSAVMVTHEGTRPLLLEVQALVDGSPLGNPRRVTVGLEHNRLAMLLAVLHRHAGVATHDQDVFVNVVGGIRVSETGADLAVLSAVLSSIRNRPLPRALVVFGEAGLAGELRPVPNAPERLREAAKHGFTRAIVPAANASRHNPKAIEVHAVGTVAEAIDACG
jgi:DNA repair protein RadA/Sms